MIVKLSNYFFRSLVQNSANRLFEPVDNSPLIVFRVVFGLLLAIEGWGAIATGWVKRVFVEPSFTFTFIGFEWLQPMLGPEMYAVYGILGLAGVMVMLGFYYRASMTVYALLWTMCYLMQKSSYNNHYYLMVLLCWAMVFMPAHRYFSLDVKQKRTTGSLTCPGWCILFFVVQVSIVYFFAALAKIYPDWLALKPIRLWFAGKAHYPIIGPYLQKEWLQALIAYGGIVFDMTIVPLLLWKRTRPYAFTISVFFHVFNSIVFGIGVFPYMMIGLSVFFFQPDRVRKVFFKNKISQQIKKYQPIRYNKVVTMVLGIYFLIQLYLPLRHHFIEGNVFWTEEGHRMAWRMMLRTKSGSIQYTIKDKITGEKWKVDPSDYLSGKQVRKLGVQPDMIWQFAKYLQQKYAKEGKPNLEIYVTSLVSLNGNKSLPLVDASVDLASEPWYTFSHAAWILSYEW